MQKEVSCGICGGKAVLSTKTHKEILEDNTVIIIHDVPCYRCTQCGEEFLTFSTWDRIDEIKKSMVERKELETKYAA